MKAEVLVAHEQSQTWTSLDRRENNLILDKYEEVKRNPDQYSCQMQEEQLAKKRKELLTV